LPAKKLGGRNPVDLRLSESRSEPYLPADPKTIRAFIEDRVKAGKKPATVKRYVATIARVHIAAALLNLREHLEGCLAAAPHPLQ
jgi:hypothetical protein